MALRAKTPVLKENRLKALMYGTHGCGKSHFCCSIPETYFIDTENIDQYDQFTEMLRENKSSFVTLNTLEEVIEEVLALMTEKHSYKTLVIDSLSVLYTEFCDKETKRLKGNKTNVEGDEYAANTRKPKRMLNHLANLLQRLDMNVIVTAHQKNKYEKVGSEDIIVKMYDIPDKLGYMLGMIGNVEMLGNNSKVRIKKTRYKEFKTNEFINLSYELFSDRLGETLFNQKTKSLTLASEKQIKQLEDLISLTKTESEVVSKWLLKAKAESYKEMDSENIQKCIDHLKNKLNAITGETNAV